MENQDDKKPAEQGAEDKNTGAVTPAAETDINTGDNGGGDEHDITWDFEDETPAADKNEGAQSTPTKGTLNPARFKELAEDIADTDDEDTVVQKLSTKIKNLSTVAGARETIEKDQELKNLRMLAGAGDEDLFIINKAQAYINSGLSQQQAEAKAREKLEEFKKKEGWQSELEDIALGIKGNLRGAIQNREREILKNVEEAQKSVDLRSIDNKVIESAKSKVSQIEGFLGMKFADKGKDAVLNKAKGLFENGELQKALKNPDTLAEFSIYLANKKQFEAAIAARKGGAQKVIKRAMEKPATGGNKKPAAKITPKNTSGKKQFDVSGFLGQSGA